MKLKNVVKILGLAFVAVFSGTSALCSVKETKSADAAGNGVDDSKETWSAIGTIQGSNWNKDFDLVYDSVDDRYEVVVDLKVNNEFKIRLNHAWSTSIGWDGNTGSNIGTYLSNNGGNFKVKTANMYTLWVKDDNVRNYGNKSYGFGIDIYTATIAEYTITYHFDETTTDTRTVTEVEDVPLLFNHVEGKRLEGWYTDEALTTKFAKNTKPTSDLHLYANYVEANDYWIYFYDENAVLGNNVAVHIFGNEYGVPAPAQAAWPGEAAENLKHGFWRYKVEADQGYDAIVVTNGAASGTKQTVDLSLSHESEIFVIGALSEGKYTAMTQGITAANLAVYVMAGSEEGQCNVQFAPARDFYLSMSASEQELFQTSDDETIAAARTRYEAWATALGQKAYEAGSLSRGSLLTTSNSNSLILVAIIASVIGVGALFAIKALKHKKEN